VHIITSILRFYGACIAARVLLPPLHDHEVGGRDDGAGSVRGGSVGLGRSLDSALGR
jgi:hypothetical protein